MYIRLYYCNILLYFFKVYYILRLIFGNKFILTYIHLVNQKVLNKWKLYNNEINIFYSVDLETRTAYTL